MTYALAWAALLAINRQAFPNDYFLSILLWLPGAALVRSDPDNYTEEETATGTLDNH